MSAPPKKARKIDHTKSRNPTLEVATLDTNVDWNIFFANPGFSEFAKQILECLDYESIQTCLDVSPVWKEYIDLHGQKILRLKKFFTWYNRVNMFEDFFLEWKKMIPYIKTKMSCFDLDILIDQIEHCGPYYCPLRWSVSRGKIWNIKFVERMIRSPFDFNTVSFTGIVKRWPGFRRNNVLHEAAWRGHTEIVKVLLRHAEDKNIDVNAKNNLGQSAIDTAIGNVQLYFITVLYTRWHFEGRTKR